MTLHIKILGGGCENCDRLAANAKQAVAQLGVDATFEKSGDYAEYQRYNLLATPGLVANDQLLSGGRVPSPQQIVTLLANVLAADTN
ncbi:MAG: thioredoxin family protein [Anaerolineae bacterium]|jgi:small redox-active disulfide protein 2|nr:thioredoxin family protein [Anaerolineae bacterium]